ncbi:hypothetical protein B0H16DRAFT_1748270 [Mycena metata]|uniref:Uncharacterized protein n=1 Tax=Mycena metata TaxID=1033252 RepID=A0AAD7E0L4_9AGAR|nr:hypothetical protein B0H16DRAFT_1748270 [Mycena metata]
MPAEQPLRSPEYWRAFHRQRALRRDRGPNPPRFLTFGAVPTPQPIVTFIPNRAAPVYSFVQNDGSLVQSYNPTALQTTPPVKSAAERALPAMSKRTTATTSTSASAASSARGRHSNASRGKTPRAPKLTAEAELLRRFRARAAAERAGLEGRRASGSGSGHASGSGSGHA